VRFEGDEGWVETGDDGEVLLSENLVRSQGRTFARPGTSAKGHGRNFFDCVKSRARPVAHQDVMRHSHIACFSAELAWELGRKVRVDPVRESFVDDEEANRRIHRAPREPWSFDV
jgi:hypothetical protein